MSLGTLRVLLGLDAAEFTRGLTKAEVEAQKFQRNMTSLGRNVGAALAGVLSAGAFVSMVKGAIDAADRLNDLSKKTGVAVETLGGLGFAATQAGGDLESTVAGLGKLNKTIAEAASGNKEASEFFEKLGIDVRDSTKQIKDAGTVYVEIADKFSKFQDGPNKAALALRGFGKAGLDQISVLNEGGQALQANIDFYKKFSGVTADTARQADEFNDTMGKLGLMAKSLGMRIATDLLPVLRELAGEFQKTGEDGITAFDSIAKGFSNFSRNFSIIAVNVKYVLSTIVKDVADSAKQLQAFFSGDFAKGMAIGDAGRARGIADRQEVDRLTRALANAVNNKPIPGIGLESLDAALRRPANRKPDAPGLRATGGGADKASQEAKKLLDKQLSDIDNFIKAEKRIFETRESDLARLYQNDQLSIAAYFDERLAALDQNTTATVELYDKQIKAQEAFAAAAKRRKDEPAVIDAQTRIGDIQAKIEDVLHEKQQRKLKLQDDVTQAAGDYADQVSEVRARVLELLGTEEAALQAAKIRFDIQNRSVIKGAKREKDPALEADVETLRKQNDAQTQINNLLKDAGVIEQNLATAQAKLHLERDLGMRDEIDTLGLVGKASGEAAAKLKIIADQYLAIAIASGKPEIIANALALKQRVDELAAATDILAAKIRQTFVDTGASAIETFLNSIAEGKNVLDSFKAAFTQFANDIIRQINRIAAQKIADSLFKSGSGGDGGIFSSIADAFVKYIGGLGGGSTAASNFGMNVREKGGPVSSRTPYIVGERGPEIFVPQTVAAAATKQIDSIIARRGKPAEYTDRVKAATVATNLPHLIGAKGPEIFVPKVAGIVIPNNKVAKLSAVLERKVPAAARRREMFAPLIAARTILRDEKIITRYANAPYSRRASGGPVAAHVPYIVGERGREIFIPKSANAAVQRDEAISKLSKAFQKQGHSGPASTAQATRIINERQIYIQKSASAILLRKQAAAELVANAPRQRRAGGGPVAARTPYVVGELGPELFMPKSAGRIIKHEKAIDDLVSNTIQHRASSSPVAANVLSERGHEILISKLVSTNIKNERVQNDLVSNTRNEKTINQLASNIHGRSFAEHQNYFYDLVTNNIQRRDGPVQARQTYIVGEPELFVTKSAEKIIKNENRVSELVTNNARRNEKVINDLVSKTVHHRQSAAPNVAAKIIKNESRISELVSNNVQRDEEIINRLVTTTRRESGRSNQLLIVGAHGPELFIPKAADRIIKNERRINELVSNIEHRNVDRRSEKTIDEIISSTVQRRAKGGPLAAYQTRLVGERGPERLIGSETNITNNNGVSVPADFFSNASYRRAMGGSVMPNQPYIVGERGPEAFVPRVAGTIVTNNQLGRSNVTTNNISVNLQGNATPGTANQIGASVARSLAIANRRMN